MQILFLVGQSLKYIQLDIKIELTDNKNMGKNTKISEKKQKNLQYYTVQKIVERKIRLDGALMYRIRWVGFSENQDTWEPVDHLTNVFYLVQQFEKNYNSALKAASKRTKQQENIVKHNKFRLRDKTAIKEDIVSESTQINKDLKETQTFEEKKSNKSQIFQKNNIQAQIKQFYQVEKIVNKKEIYSRKQRIRKTVYRVRWVGYSENQDTWEPIENLGLVYKMVEDFNKQEQNRRTQNQIENQPYQNNKKTLNTEKTKQIIKQEDKMNLKKQRRKQKCYYEVQKVVGKRKINSETEYRVRWKGYSQNQDTWEPMSHLHRITRLIHNYQHECMQKNNDDEFSDQMHDQKMGEDKLLLTQKVTRLREDLGSILKQTDNYEIGGVYEDYQSIVEELNQMQQRVSVNKGQIDEIQSLLPLQFQERQLVQPDFI